MSNKGNLKIELIQSFQLVYREKGTLPKMGSAREEVEFFLYKITLLSYPVEVDTTIFKDNYHYNTLNR